MPTLPTLEVTDAQAALLLDAFAGQNDPVTGEQMTPQRAYKRWLRDTLVAHVVTIHSLDIDARAAEVKRLEVEEFAASLPSAP